MAVESGEPVLPTMLVPEIVVKAGTRVRVRIVFGGYELIREMQALEDGAVGDRIECGEPGAPLRSGRRAGKSISADSIMARMTSSVARPQ